MHSNRKDAQENLSDSSQTKWPNQIHRLHIPTQHEVCCPSNALSECSSQVVNVLSRE